MSGLDLAPADPTRRQEDRRRPHRHPACLPIPEVAGLGLTLRAWRTQVLAHFDTDGVSNGGTEANNLIIETTRCLAHSFRTLDRYRRRILLAASAPDPGGPATHRSEEPVNDPRNDLVCFRPGVRRRAVSEENLDPEMSSRGCRFRLGLVVSSPHPGGNDNTRCPG